MRFLVALGFWAAINGLLQSLWGVVDITDWRWLTFAVGSGIALGVRDIVMKRLNEDAHDSQR